MADADEYPERCWGCGGTQLPLKVYPAEGYGVGPASREDRSLCPVCRNSHAVSRCGSGGDPLSCAESDILIGNHMILAAIERLGSSDA